MQIAVLTLSAALAWPIAVLAWSLPRRAFAPEALGRAPALPRLLSLALPPAAALWAIAALPPVELLPPLVLLGWFLAALAVIDARAFILPDLLTLPLILLGVLQAALLAYGGPADRLMEAGFSALAAAIGFVFLAGLARLFRALRGIEGLGLGDAKLLAAAGAWLGVAALPSVILLAALGALCGTAVQRRLGGVAIDARTPIPFGPYLAAATWIVALYGPLSLL